VTDNIEISIPTHEDWDSIYQAISAAFNEDGDEASSGIERAILEFDRSLIARRDGQIVGTAGIYTRQLGVPGAAVPAGHVTMISVAPTARRQGILTRFMHQQFDDMRAAGEPLAVLWASEGRIYQRFGYGLAARRMSINAENREVSLTVAARGTGRLREATPDEVRDTLVKVYDAAFAQHPGWSERSARHWDNRLADPTSIRRGATARRAVIHEGESGIDGYGLWRVQGKWNDNGPGGEVRVNEVIATSTEAYTAIWRFLLTVDLTRTTEAWCISVDEPLFFLVNEPRRLNARIADGLWLRILDVPQALAARRYATDIDVVIEVTDHLIPTNAGRFRLIGSAESASCVSTADEPDLRCDVRALGAAYLGGTPLTALAVGGLVEEVRPGSLDPVSTAFGWHRAPSAVEVF
jgi:predicted acetyltransferase